MVTVLTYNKSELALSELLLQGRGERPLVFVVGMICCGVRDLVLLSSESLAGLYGLAVDLSQERVWRKGQGATSLRRLVCYSCSHRQT